MSLAEPIEKMRQALGPCFEAVFQQGEVPFASLVSGISDVQCTPEEFTALALQLSPEQAKVLLVATLHRSMAYSSELLSLENARELASEFIAKAGENASFYSTCEVEDEVSGVGSWRLMITSHTFESVLYCKGAESALLVMIDED